mmetsp:Transcript_4288/g.12992  ORF Transcript_4288/g.12992 Transcript_4288/m.12992 type:complete len:214 (-) Transcript_4288:712-1353(-)
MSALGSLAPATSASALGSSKAPRSSSQKASALACAAPPEDDEDLLDFLRLFAPPLLPSDFPRSLSKFLSVSFPPFSLPLTYLFSRVITLTPSSSTSRMTAAVLCFFVLGTETSGVEKYPPSRPSPPSSSSKPTKSGTSSISAGLRSPPPLSAMAPPPSSCTGVRVVLPGSSVAGVDVAAAMSSDRSLSGSSSNSSPWSPNCSSVYIMSTSTEL